MIGKTARLSMIALLLATAHSTLSAETKLTHGAQFCQQSGSGGELIRTFQGTLRNGSYTQTLHVLCPVVRVANNASTGKACVNTLDRNTGDGITCSFYDQRAYGHVWTWSGWKTTNGGSSTNYKTLTFGPYTSQDKFDGYHHFYCKIPPRVTAPSSDPTQGYSWIGSYSTGG